MRAPASAETRGVSAAGEPLRTAANGDAETRGASAVGEPLRTATNQDPAPGDWPFARLGYLYATCVGFPWGALLSTGRVRRVDGLWVFTGMPKWSFGRGGSCVGACYLTANNDGAAVLRHERVHREQWRRYGLAMPILYFFAGKDPLRNRFEIEAGLEDGGYLPKVSRRPEISR